MMEEDEELKKIDEEIEKLKALDTSGYGSPEPPRKDSIVNFFRELITTKDSTKIGNLNENELGVTKLGVRHLLNLGNYAEVEGLDMVADYFRDQAEVVSASSMSRKGFLVQASVTQIKKEQKIEKPKEKKKWFQKKIEEE